MNKYIETKSVGNATFLLFKWQDKGNSCFSALNIDRIDSVDVDASGSCLKLILRINGEEYYPWADFFCLSQGYCTPSCTFNAEFDSSEQPFYDLFEMFFGEINKPTTA